MSLSTEYDQPEGDVPRSVCDQCDASFYIFWDNSPTIEGVKFCPFCGAQEGVDG